MLEVGALICNVGLNAVFFFGFFGAPKLSVVGVALAYYTQSFASDAGMLCCFVGRARGLG